MLIHTQNRYDFMMASEIVNKLIEYGYVDMWIRNKKSGFDHTNLSKEEIADHVSSYWNYEACYLKAHRFWRYSRARADYQNSVARINTRHKLALNSLCGSVAHEWCHHIEKIVKSRVDGVYFNHGDNYATGKKHTVPYYIGKKVKAFITELEFQLGSNPLRIYEYLVNEHGK